MKPQHAPHQVWQFIFGYMVGVIPYFMLPSLITLALVERGVDPSTIGVVASMQALGLLVSLPLTPFFVRRTTERRVLLSATWVTLLATTLATIGPFVPDARVVWAVASILAGAGAGIRYVIAQNWATSLAPSAARGRIVGIFETLLAVSSFAAPSILLLTGATSYLPFGIAALLVVIGMVIIAPIHPPPVERTPTPAQRERWLFGSLSAPLVVAAFLGGLFETGMFTALPLFSITIGFTVTHATLVIMVISIGSMGQFLFSYLADRFRWQRVLVSTTAFVTLAPLLLLVVPTFPGFIWPLSLLLGVAGGGLYTLAIICVSTTYHGAHLVQGITSLAFFYVMGSTLGPAVGGLALDLSPRYGMPIIFATAALLGLAVMLHAARPRRPSPPIARIEEA